uniref:Chromo domain-containing protein n=1 Tax=Sinocyclocheilus grahami TaxID=75366 RepID=A0A672LK54_SINGR
MPQHIYITMREDLHNVNQQDRTNTNTSMDPRPPTPAEVLEEMVNALRASLFPPTTPQSASVSPMAMPASYTGDAMQPQIFLTERTKVAFLISLLNGRALLWAKAIWNANSAIINSYDAFTNHFKKVFGHTAGVHDYTLRFRTLAATSGWNEVALISSYRQGLNPHVQAQMNIYDDSVGLESFMQRANRISQRLSACHATEATHQPVTPGTGSPVPEPMQVDTSRLTPSESARRLAAGLCLYCTAADRPAGSILQLDPVISTLSMLSVQLLTPDLSVSVPALVDSGSSGNFISQDLLNRLHLPRKRHAQEAPTLRLKFGTLHEEEITFLVLEGRTVDNILGRPWLVLHSPEIRWDSCEVTRWSEHCHRNCLTSLPTPLPGSHSAQVASTLIESPEPWEKVTVPSDYLAFQDIFSKQASNQLPPHRPWDCAIDLLPGAKLPKGRVYPLSILEHKAFADARRTSTPTYHPGEQVWLSTRDLRLRLPCKKLSPRYIGPFPIQRQINEVTYELRLPPRYRIHTTFHVSLLKPHSPSAPGPTEPDEPPPPEILDQPSIYLVRDILDLWRRGGRLEYLIDWDGYGPEECSWVARDDLLDPLLLEDFHHTHPGRPAPRSRGRPHRRMRASGATPGGGGG